MAAVLRINPGRIRVTNIVPGNGRRRRQLRAGAGEGLLVKLAIDEQDNSRGHQGYDELIEVADLLNTSATEGTLDTGFKIVQLAIQKPPDDCGVS